MHDFLAIDDFSIKLIRSSHFFFDLCKQKSSSGGICRAKRTLFSDANSRAILTSAWEDFFRKQDRFFRNLLSFYCLEFSFNLGITHEIHSSSESDEEAAPIGK